MQSDSTTRMQRFLRGAVACLLTANGFAVAALIGGDAITGPGGPEAAAAPATRTMTLVTTRDGKRFVADPSTPEGRKAIENALKQGATVQQVTTPPTTQPGQTPPTTDQTGRPIVTIPKPGVGGNSLPVLPIDVGDTLNGVVDTVNGVTDTVSGTINDLPVVPDLPVDLPVVPVVPDLPVVVPVVPDVPVDIPDLPAPLALVPAPVQQVVAPVVQPVQQLVGGLPGL